MGQWGAQAKALAWPDIEEVVVPFLTQLMADAGETVTVGIGKPQGWTPNDPPHVEVAWDGTPRTFGSLVAWATIRIVARAATTREAKRLAALAQALLCAAPSNGEIENVQPLTGVLPARDAATRAELAAVTCRVTIKSTSV